MDIKYAGFWRRLGAFIIDALILTGASLALVIIISSIGVILGGNYGAYLIILMYPLAFIGQWLYFSIFESSGKQATPGKILLGIVVTNKEGGKISFGRATGRFFAHTLFAMLLYIGHLFILFTSKKQTLHDLMTKTLVVRK